MPKPLAGSMGLLAWRAGAAVPLLLSEQREDSRLLRSCFLLAC